MNITKILIIIKTFDVIIFINTLINNQRYIYHDRLRQIIIKDRQSYQNLIFCVINVVEDFDNDKRSDENINKKIQKNWMRYFRSRIQSMWNRDEKTRKSHRQVDLKSCYRCLMFMQNCISIFSLIIIQL